ncbi:peptide chain release factor N(5)-glutamine methyltransferase [Hyphococcus sp.]|uniref:peptide chain release factor N(5)-glutamine methyltransferase n=1 Tax=Hyphococcus sp. TaxID=2038636 RepID=UPI003D116017
MPDASLTIGEALRSGAKFLANSETPQLDARILLKRALGADDASLIANADALLSGDDYNRYSELLKRRASSEPVAYITGEKEFWSLTFKVTPDVLIPRDDSGALIEAAIKRRGKEERLRIADLGTGSGCLLCALLTEFPEARGVGVDLSAAALAVARENAASLGLAERASFAAGDWLAPLSGAFDVVIANPPYIRETDASTLSQDVAAFEPHGALFAGPDGLDAYRAILKELPGHLAGDALVLMECGADQADSLGAMLGEIAPGDAIFTLYDLAKRPRGAGFDLRKREKKD